MPSLHRCPIGFRPRTCRWLGERGSLAIFVIAALLVTAVSAAADSALQITRNGEQVLISKDVGAERWAITFDPDGGSITGNAFAADGPAFIDCRVVKATLADLTFECFALAACSTEPCGRDWTRLPERVTLPFEFLLPAGASPPQSVPALCAAIGGGWTLNITNPPPGFLSSQMSIAQDGCTFDAHDVRGALHFSGTIAGDVLSIATRSTDPACPFVDQGTGYASPTLLYATFQRSFAEDCAASPPEVALLATRSP